jgi:Zn-dependent protease
MLKFLLWGFSLFKFLRGFSLGTWFGIPIKITSSWIVLLLTLAACGWLFQGPATAVITIIIVSFAYGCVLLHELGHSLVAIKLGYKVRDITIWPLAGAACIEGDWNTKPKDEFWISIAGPTVNIFIALLMLPITYSSENLLLLYPCLFCLEINVSLVCFNLIPIFPMDGGRILRACLTSCMNGDCQRSTALATKLAFVFCLAACPTAWFLGYYTAAIILPMIAWFGRMELKGIIERDLLQEIKLKFKQIDAIDEKITRLQRIPVYLWEAYNFEEMSLLMTEKENKLVRIEELLGKVKS